MYIYGSISQNISLEREMFERKVLEKIKHIFYVQYFFPPKIVPFM
jgi:hypothetical protein